MNAISQPLAAAVDALPLPLVFRAYPNHPNPFNPTTTIRFSIPAEHRVTLTVYDLLGKPVAVLVDGQLQAGVHSTQFNGERLPSGMYFCKLQAGGHTSVQRMMLVK